MQSMGMSMDWALEDNMVDGLFSCATLTGRRGGHTPFVQAGTETSDTGAEGVMLSKLLFKLLITCEGALSIIAFLCSCMKKWTRNYKSFSTFLKFVGYLEER